MFFLVVTASFRAWQEREMMLPGDCMAPGALDDLFTAMIKPVFLPLPKIF